MADYQTRPIKGPERQPFIDLLRFIAAMMVATMHWGLEIGNERFRDIYDLPIIGPLVKNGSFGVNIFFVISGYVIIGTAQKYNVAQFIFARFSRLFPGLLFSMLIVLLVGSHFIHPYERPFTSFLHSTFLTYQAAGIQPLATPLWTLIIEIKFYTGVAIALLLFPKLFKSSTGVLILITSWELVIIVLQETSSPAGSFFYPYVTLNGSHYLFALGICLNLLSKISQIFTRESFFLALVSLYFMNEVFVHSGYANILKLYMAIACALIVFGRKIILQYSLQRISYWLGVSSYLIYLLHEHLGMVFVLQIQSRITTNIYIVVALTTLLITLFCVLAAIFVEKPLQKFTKRKLQRFYLNHSVR